MVGPMVRRKPCRMKRVALFAHFDAEDQIKPYIVYFLSALRQVAADIVFVSTARLPAQEMDKVRPYASQVLLRENIGLDFAMWRHGLEHSDLGDTDELILTNSSLFGPMFPLAPILERMGEAPCDFWGMTDNFEYRWHLQSYFLVIKRAVLVSPSWARFWGGVLALRDKEQVILSYEVGFTSFLVESGFVPGALAPIQSWAPWLVRRRMDLERRWNTTLFIPKSCSKWGCPSSRRRSYATTPAMSIWPPSTAPCGAPGTTSI